MDGHILAHALGDTRHKNAIFPKVYIDIHMRPKQYKELDQAHDKDQT